MTSIPALSDMEAVILCGGLGTRLREETEFKPKPMVEIGGRPILWHIMQRYARYGVRRFVLCLGYKGDSIRDYFLNFRHYNSDFTVRLSTSDVMSHGSGKIPDWEVVLAETGENTMTGSRISRAMQHIKNDQFFVTYGDGVADVDIGSLYQSHLSAGKWATLTSVRPASRYGEITISDKGIVEYFMEKPQVSEGSINGGYFVFNKETFRKFGPANPIKEQNVFLEKDILTKLAEANQLFAYRHEGFWQCMDTYREMQLLNDAWNAGNAPWILP
jgi:glucose-1-phosphate cytidylyltransferase